MLDFNVGLALLTAIGTAAATIFYSGRQIGRIEAAVARLTKLEEALKDVPLLRTDVEILKNLYERAHSDFRNLQNRFENSEKEQVEIRVKLASQHDG
jgi:molecular chaperone GrpE (heat shock protein)